MNTMKRMIGVTAILAASAGFASSAMADVSTATCGDFAAMDDTGRLNYAHDLLKWIADTANFEAAGPALTGRYAASPIAETSTQTDVLKDDQGGWSHQQMKIEIEAHCIKMPANTSIVEQLKSHT